MNRFKNTVQYIITILSLVGFTGYAYGAGGLANSCLSVQIPVTEFHETELGDKLDLDPTVIEKYQAAAKFLSVSKAAAKSVDTSIVTYETTFFGVHCHVGWYSDGNIATSLDGTETGKQVVYLNGAIVGISYDIEFKNDHFIHKYTWGKVYSYTNRQVVKIN